MDDALNNAVCSDSACGHQFWTHLDVLGSWYECPLCGSKSMIKPPERRLKEMRTLKLNWDSYGGKPPSEETIERAETALTYFGGYRPCRVAPSAAGGPHHGSLAFTWKNGDGARAYLEFHDDGKDYLLLSDAEGEQEPVVECVSTKTYPQVLSIVQSYLQGG